MDADHHVPSPPVPASTDHTTDAPAAPDPPQPPAGVRGDKDLLRAAAQQLRHSGTQGFYRGRRRPEQAYGLASVLDMAEVRWHDHDDETRAEIRRCCRVLIDAVPDLGDR